MKRDYMVIVYRDIPIKEIKKIEDIRSNPFEDIHVLMESIKQHGLLEPIGVNEITPHEYVLKFGGRRLAAYDKLGYTTIPSMVYQEEDAMKEEEHIVLNAIENLQRKDVTPVELGRICSRLIDLGLSQVEISVRLGITKNRVQDSVTIYTGVPEEHKKSIDFRTDNKNPSKVGSTIASAIMRARKAAVIKPEEVGMLFDLVKKKELTGDGINKLVALMRGGMPLSEAQTKIDDYGHIELHFTYNSTKMEVVQKQTGHSRRKIAKMIIKKQMKNVVDLEY